MGTKRIVAFGSTSMLTKTSTKSNYEQGIVEQLKAAETKVVEITAAEKGQLTLLRPTMIYGVGLDANLTRMADVIRRFGALPIHGAASGIRQPVQAQDLATAALDVIDKPETFGKAYNLGGGQALSYFSMVTALFTYLGKKPRIFRIPFMVPLLNTMGKVYQLGHINGEIALRMNQDMVFDVQEAAADFSYRPQGFLQGDVEI